MTAILCFHDRIYNSCSVLKIRRDDNGILYNVLWSKISTFTVIVMVPLSCSQVLLSFFPFTSLPPQSCDVHAAFFFSDNETEGTSLVRREGVRRQRQDECLCGDVYACRGCAQGW